MLRRSCNPLAMRQIGKAARQFGEQIEQEQAQARRRFQAQLRLREEAIRQEAARRGKHVPPWRITEWRKQQVQRYQEAEGTWREQQLQKFREKAQEYWEEYPRKEPEDKEKEEKPETQIHPTFLTEGHPTYRGPYKSFFLLEGHPTYTRKKPPKQIAPYVAPSPEEKKQVQLYMEPAEKEDFWSGVMEKWQDIIGLLIPMQHAKETVEEMEKPLAQQLYEIKIPYKPRSPLLFTPHRTIEQTMHYRLTGKPVEHRPFAPLAGFIAPFERDVYTVTELIGWKTPKETMPTLSGGLVTSGIETVSARKWKRSPEMEQWLQAGPGYQLGSFVGEVAEMAVFSKVLSSVGTGVKRGARALQKTRIYRWAGQTRPGRALAQAKFTLKMTKHRLATSRLARTLRERWWSAKAKVQPKLWKIRDWLVGPPEPRSPLLVSTPHRLYPEDLPLEYVPKTRAAQMPKDWLKGFTREAPAKKSRFFKFRKISFKKMPKDYLKGLGPKEKTRKIGLLMEAPWKKIPVETQIKPTTSFSKVATAKGRIWFIKETGIERYAGAKLKVTPYEVMEIRRFFWGKPAKGMAELYLAKHPLTETVRTTAFPLKHFVGTTYTPMQVTLRKVLEKEPLQTAPPQQLLIEKPTFYKPKLPYVPKIETTKSLVSRVAPNLAVITKTLLATRQPKTAKIKPLPTPKITVKPYIRPSTFTSPASATAQKTAQKTMQKLKSQLQTRQEAMSETALETLMLPPPKPTLRYPPSKLPKKKRKYEPTILLYGRYPREYPVATPKQIIEKMV